MSELIQFNPELLEPLDHKGPIFFDVSFRASYAGLSHGVIVYLRANWAESVYKSREVLATSNQDIDDILKDLRSELSSAIKSDTKSPRCDNDNCLCRDL